MFKCLCSRIQNPFHIYLGRCPGSWVSRFFFGGGDFRLISKMAEQHFHQQCTRIFILPHLCHPFLSFVFLTVKILTRVRCDFNRDLICSSQTTTMLSTFKVLRSPLDFSLFSVFVSTNVFFLVL